MSSSIPPRFLSDTNIISELSRPEPNPGVLAWAKDVPSLAVSAISVEEIFSGLTWRPNPRIREWFEQFLDRYCQVLQGTEEIARVCGSLRGDLRATGTTRPQADLLIAATARVHQITLVTRNTRDFADCRVSLLNPFS